LEHLIEYIGHWEMSLGSLIEYYI